MKPHAHWRNQPWFRALLLLAMPVVAGYSWPWPTVIALLLGSAAVISVHRSLLRAEDEKVTC